MRCLCFGAALSLVARSLLSRYRHRCCLSPCGSSRCLLGGGDVIPSGVLAPTGSPCSSPRALRGCGSYPARACPLSVRCGGSSRPAAAFPVAPALCLLAGVIRSVAGYVPIRRSPRPACRGAGRAVACCRLSRVVICLYFSDVVVWGGSSRCGGGVEKKIGGGFFVSRPLACLFVFFSVGGLLGRSARFCSRPGRSLGSRFRPSRSCRIGRG